MPSLGFAPTPIVKSWMLFIDGGYLRKGFIDSLGHDNINYQKLERFIRDGSVPQLLPYRLQLYPVRVYYYDAIADAQTHPTEHKEESKYFEKLRKTMSFEVKLGRHIITPKRNEQKGVDVRIAIDMVTKAYQNHYDIATLFAGDDDFVDIVNTVKDIAGKQVVGASFEWNLSPKLAEVFDNYIRLSKETLKDFAGTPK
jgi:uncharacterized LabA/DUF88 family protein